VVVPPVAVLLKDRLAWLAPDTVHLYVLISEPSCAWEPVASSVTSAPAGVVDGKACRNVGDAMLAVGSDMRPM
jgi:hypothetical protein